MGNLKEWVKKHIIASIILSFVIIFLPVLLIHILYSIEMPCKFFMAKWSAGELLQFYGSLLSFGGTVLLGGLALWQNQQLAIKNQKFNELINNQQKQMNIPRFNITSSMGSNGTFANWYIHLKNVSENIANGLIVSSFSVHDKERQLIYSKEKCKISNNALLSGEEAKIEFENTALHGDYLVVRFMIDFEDKYNESHRYEVKAEILNQKSPDRFNFILIE
ncbi:hypothetical protein [Clostridium butyricum]|uniref:hypothetical protein n=1 Tax=Clostridium butyricum TaxID=1492 RepID=UPI002AAF76E8|nr:hypothetical protein [Clostridium butyricum]